MSVDHDSRGNWYFYDVRGIKRDGFNTRDAAARAHSDHKDAVEIATSLERCASAIRDVLAKLE